MAPKYEFDGFCERFPFHTTPVKKAAGGAMKQKRLTIVAVICGAVCALCVFAFMGTVQGEANAARAEALARYGGEQVDVCVATRDIAAGERIDASAIETRLWVADLLPEGAVRDANEIVGKTAASSILKGEVLSTKRFERPRDILDVPVGKVAVSVSAKTVQAVGGAVHPGMYVDIYATGDTAATALAEDVLVLATSSDESGSIVSDAAWITIALNPDQVQEMVTATSRYDLYFVLPADADAAAQAASSGESDAAAAQGQTQSAEDNAKDMEKPSTQKPDGDISDGVEGATSQEVGDE